MAIEKVEGIVIDTIRHSDRHNIVTLFTRRHGRVALLSAAGNGKSARLRNAALLPLSVIETEINFNPARELSTLRAFTRTRLWKNLYFDPVKSALALFIAEFLKVFLRESGPDEHLWSFVVRAVDKLDSCSRGLANFHLAFLMDFLNYAGIRPDLSDWNEGAWFDLRGGTFSLTPPTHRDRLDPDTATFLPVLNRLSLRTAPVFRFNASQRRNLLSMILRYYSIHFPGLASLNSPAVLTEVFSR